MLRPQSAMVRGAIKLYNSLDAWIHLIDAFTGLFCDFGTIQRGFIFEYGYHMVAAADQYKEPMY